MSEITQEQEAKAFQDRLDNVVSKLAKGATKVGICVLDRKDNSVGANAGSEGAFLSNYFKEMAEAGFADRGTEALVARELAGAKLENCAAGAVPVGSVKVASLSMASR
ncbi:MAG: hypothetical protein A3J37_07595 [Alphaproteobacteria bacterium RIFCSPHIGHO2_12_FULL_45_9]|nr:MAG: hypothetical protein A3B66_06330 [Alphaproteobacteria bacterium RIFCSPHIGHO2_02_FULL_46_13]OFW99656.1 MAG: hypothetical protein A3J37_07595 [Alphaproteobacteria bacterium RIFCSPHIGHO2_12_FULL_45_9]